jgi:hypothetical protein
MLGQFFGDSFGEFGTEMPEKRLAPGTEQAHETVANQNEAGQFEKSFSDEFLFHKIWVHERASDESHVTRLRARLRRGRRVTSQCRCGTRAN